MALLCLQELAITEPITHTAACLKQCSEIQDFFGTVIQFLTVMKVFLAITLCVLSFLASAQEQQIIGGYLLDGKDSFEELDAAVVTDSKREDKNLDGKGMRLPGGAMMMIPESVGKEIGSIVEVKDPFLVKSICFTVDENRMEGCKASNSNWTQ